MVDYLNKTQSEDTIWIVSNKWCNMSSENARFYSPIVSHAQFHKRFIHRNVPFAPFEDNPGDGVVQVKHKYSGKVLFGKIISIFTHQRCPIIGQTAISDTWASVQFFPWLQTHKSNPISQVDEPEMQTHLCLYKKTKPQLVHMSEIISHCNFLIYEAGEIHEDLDKKTIALVSLDRE